MGARMLLESGTNNELGLIGMERLRELLGISERTRRRWEQQGMPVHKRGRSSFYDPAEVRAWVKGERPHGDAPKRRAGGR